MKSRQLTIEAKSMRVARESSQLMLQFTPASEKPPDVHFEHAEHLSCRAIFDFAEAGQLEILRKLFTDATPPPSGLTRAYSQLYSISQHDADIFVDGQKISLCALPQDNSKEEFLGEPTSLIMSPRALDLGTLCVEGKISSMRTTRCYFPQSLCVPIGHGIGLRMHSTKDHTGTPRLTTDVQGAARVLLEIRRAISLSLENVEGDIKIVNPGETPDLFNICRHCGKKP